MFETFRSVARMKIGDALQERAAAQRKIADLRGRIAATVTTNEDEAPIEDPTALLVESDAVADRLGDLIRRINASNSATSFPSGGTVTEALARRDDDHAPAIDLFQHLEMGQQRPHFTFRVKLNEIIHAILSNEAHGVFRLPQAAQEFGWRWHRQCDFCGQI